GVRGPIALRAIPVVVSRAWRKLLSFTSYPVGTRYALISSQKRRSDAARRDRGRWPRGGPAARPDGHPPLRAARFARPAPGRLLDRRVRRARPRRVGSCGRSGRLRVLEPRGGPARRARWARERARRVRGGFDGGARGPP